MSTYSSFVNGVFMEKNAVLNKKCSIGGLGVSFRNSAIVYACIRDPILLE
ncbi:MAG: hypothetical protein ACYTBY_03145 [Planctomycetota bacterium]